MDIEFAMLTRTQNVNIVQAKVDSETIKNKRTRWVQLPPAHMLLFPIIQHTFSTSLSEHKE